MADNYDVYTEGGLPSNRQVWGVRSCKVTATEDSPLVGGDTYKLLELASDEVILSYALRVSVGNAPFTGLVSFFQGATELAALSDIGLDSVGTYVGNLAELAKGGVGDVGTISFVTAENITDAEFTFFAIVVNVKSLESKPVNPDGLAP